MTNNEIITALRAVAKNYEGKFVRTFETNINAMATDAADHIERLCEENNFLKAEIESLQAENEEQHQAIINALKHMAEIKPKAIEEFAENIKKELFLIRKECRKFLENDGVFAIDKAIRKIDNLVKEISPED